MKTWGRYGGAATVAFSCALLKGSHDLSILHTFYQNHHVVIETINIVSFIGLCVEASKIIISRRLRRQELTAYELCENLFGVDIATEAVVIAEKHRQAHQLSTKLKNMKTRWEKFNDDFSNGRIEV